MNFINNYDEIANTILHFLKNDYEIMERATDFGKNAQFNTLTGIKK